MTVVSPDLLTFELAGHRLALPVACVQSVVRAAEVTPLPNAPHGVDGALNLHGDAIAVVDLRTRLGLPSRALSPTDYFLVCELPDRRLVLRVDRVLAVRPPAREPLEALGGPELAGVAARVTASEDGLVVVSDLARLLDAAESAALAAALSDAVRSPA